MRRLRFIIIIICFSLLLNIICFSLFTIKKEHNDSTFSSSTTKTDNTNSNKTNNKQFNDKEKKIIKAIYDNETIKNSFDIGNLKSFEVIKLKSAGYYKSKPNIRYINVDYSSSCKDGTYNCDNLGMNYSLLELNESLTFWIAVDMNTYLIVDVMKGISVSINSDWVATKSDIE